MKWAALIAWVITAGGGFVLLSIWLMRDGMRQQQEAGNRIRPPLILMCAKDWGGRTAKWC